MTVEIRALRPEDDRTGFRSGDEALDLYFRRYAGQNQFRHHIGVTYVAHGGGVLVGFVTLSAGSVDAEYLPVGRKMPPYPLPILRIARLAVDALQRGRSIGGALLRFCVELAERMAEEVGCVGLVVDAKAGAEDFYRRFGFEQVEVIEGKGGQRPTPTAMFLSLGSVPRRTTPGSSLSLSGVKRPLTAEDDLLGEKLDE